MTALLMFNPLALLANLLEALADLVAPRPKPRYGPAPQAEVLPFARPRT